MSQVQVSSSTNSNNSNNSNNSSIDVSQTSIQELLNLIKSLYKIIEGLNVRLEKSEKSEGEGKSLSGDVSEYVDKEVLKIADKDVSKNISKVISKVITEDVICEVSKRLVFVPEKEGLGGKLEKLENALVVKNVDKVVVQDVQDSENSENSENVHVHEKKNVTREQGKNGTNEHKMTVHENVRLSVCNKERKENDIKPVHKNVKPSNITEKKLENTKTNDNENDILRVHEKEAPSKITSYQNQ